MGSGINDTAASDRQHWPVVKGSLRDLESSEIDLSATTTLEERFATMWQLAQDAWAFRGEPIDESTSPRLVSRVLRLRSR
jgi:hypothetical protein